MALTEPELAAMTSAVAARITGTVLGREVLRGGSVEIEIAGAAVLFCCDSRAGRSRGDLARGVNKARGLAFRKPAPCRRA